MKDLAVRLAALDADAGAALRVIAYFDSLAESRAGLQAIVRGAAVLAGCPARLDDAQRRVHVRVDPDGHAAPAPGTPSPEWMCADAGTAVLHLERSGAPGPVDAMILERAAGAARAVLDRTRGRAPAADPALVELIVDATAPSDVRAQAFRNLNPAATRLWRAIALPNGPALIPADGPLPAAARAAGSTAARSTAAVPPGRMGAARTNTRRSASGPTVAGPDALVPDAVGPTVAVPAVAGRAVAGRAVAVRAVAVRAVAGQAVAAPAVAAPAVAVRAIAGRAGIGPAVEPVDLPASYAAAQVALRFAADGTDEDPGPAVVEYTTLGALALLADLPPTTDVPDLRILEHAAAAAPWVLSTLHAYAESPSLRAAAATLRVHHSTLQDRISHAEHLLGWTVREPRGRLRLQLALAVRRLRRHPGNA